MSFRGEVFPLKKKVIKKLGRWESFDSIRRKCGHKTKVQIDQFQDQSARFKAKIVSIDQVIRLIVWGLNKS